MLQCGCMATPASAAHPTSAAHLPTSAAATPSTAAATAHAVTHRRFSSACDPPASLPPPSSAASPCSPSRSACRRRSSAHNAFSYFRLSARSLRAVSRYEPSFGSTTTCASTTAFATLASTTAFATLASSPRPMATRPAKQTALAPRRHRRAHVSVVLPWETDFF